jgi:HD-like signal output (HDOD) protein/prolyl-tRNA editing enzyme YbaK/EbsC (Cys-tRNA(Pro) deacylase)
MSTSNTVHRFLEAQDIPFNLVPISASSNGALQSGDKEISFDAIARAIILKDMRGMLMAVLPSSCQLNLGVLNRQLHRRLQPAKTADYRGVFADCQPKLLPALGEAYGFETIIDDSLLDQDYVYLFTGNPGELVRISGQDFQLLHSNAWYGNTFSNITRQPEAEAGARPASSQESAVTQISTKATMRQRIERLTELPAMPSLSQKILQLNANPYAHAEDLAKLVERDPSLSAQIVRYAQSPFYGYQGKVMSVRQAISRVLGYDMVMNIALGISSTRPFKLPKDGPLGLSHFWRHATYSACISQALCNAVPRAQRPRPGTAYLAGLLHDFGFLVLGHLFPKEFAQLQEAVSQNPQTPVATIEQELLGITHMEVGAWLMEAWNMPEEIIVTQKEHHNHAYSGPYANYVHVINLSDAMLSGYEMSDAVSEELPQEAMTALSLDEEKVQAVLDRTIEEREELDGMARQMVA